MQANTRRIWAFFLFSFKRWLVSCWAFCLLLSVQFNNLQPTKRRRIRCSSTLLLLLLPSFLPFRSCCRLCVCNKNNVILSSCCPPLFSPFFVDISPSSFLPSSCPLVLCGTAEMISSVSIVPPWPLSVHGLLLKAAPAFPSLPFLMAWQERKKN